MLLGAVESCFCFCFGQLFFKRTVHSLSSLKLRFCLGQLIILVLSCFLGIFESLLKSCDCLIVCRVSRSVVACVHLKLWRLNNCSLRFMEVSNCRRRSCLLSDGLSKRTLCFSAEPTLSIQCSCGADDIRVNVLLEGFRPPWDSKGNDVNRSVRQLESSHDFAHTGIDLALGHESHASARCRGLEGFQQESIGRFLGDLVVADVAVSLAGQVHHLCVNIIEGHQHSCGRVDVC
mmetsp:Transcript_26522/g.47629  ORF Transcript_26522/g.47629 Transcript_26522/m.47629 type:complete len:233 (-) Transcript_26522:4025-4723(-)